MKRMRIGTLIFALFVPLLVGGLSAALSYRAMLAYGTMNKPPLSPPPWVFSVVWTLLYIMMGVASYFVLVSEAELSNKVSALIVYSIQLLLNFMWSIFFFNMSLHLVAFFWLMLMWCMVLYCAYEFYSINRVASFLLFPYVLWLTFAAYLNFGVFYLEMKSNSV